jgi:hypothetical protein
VGSLFNQLMKGTVDRDNRKTVENLAELVRCEQVPGTLTFADSALGRGHRPR